jgi:hypothetical protein
LLAAVVADGVGLAECCRLDDTWSWNGFDIEKMGRSKRLTLVSRCGFHTFRHGNATLLDQIGAPMAVRLNRLGHAEAQTTMGYTHAVTADERRIADELGKILHATARNEQEGSGAPKALTLRIQ